jgi:solute carrier family 35 protein C2
MSAALMCGHLGIALFTWHKYKKALDSPVPLDPHGNPIEEEEVLVGNGHLELEETEPLAVRMSMHHERDRVSVGMFCSSCPAHTS